MSYFKHFPKIIYSFGDDKDVDLKVLTDVMTNVRLIKQVTKNITLYEEYDLQEGETPEILAHRLYGSADYHWLIMLVNERYDLYTDFPLSQEEMDKVINDRYSNPDAIKHYVDSEGVVVDSSFLTAKPVSFRDYEYSLNDAKRRIKLIAPNLATKLYNELRTLLGN